MILPEGTPGVAFGTAADGDPRSDPERRRDISSRLGIEPEWAWVRQVHGSTVLHAVEPGVGAEADAVITTDPRLPVGVSVADCLPVAILARGAAAIVHAGWRGAADGVVDRTLQVLRSGGHEPHRMVIGPGIGPCCFEVGPEVAERFPGNTSTTTWDTGSVDLPAAVAARAGPGIEVVTTGRCTHHDDGFHSYRRTGTSERQFGVAWLPA